MKIILSIACKDNELNPIREKKGEKLCPKSANVAFIYEYVVLSLSLKVRKLSVPTQILVESEKEFVRRVIDIANVYYSPEDRIDGIEYEIFEAMIWANKELGTINSAAAETFVKAYIEKPNMDRKSYDRYRRRLKEKGWLLHDGQYYQLLGIFSSGDGCLFGKNGLKKTATIPLMVIRN